MNNVGSLCLWESHQAWDCYCQDSDDFFSHSPQTFLDFERWYAETATELVGTQDCNSEIFNETIWACTQEVTRYFGCSRWESATIATGAAAAHPSASECHHDYQSQSDSDTPSASVTSDTGVHPNVDELRGDARRCNSGRTNLYPTYSGNNARLVMLEFHCRGLARLPVSQLAKLSTKNDLLLLSIISVDKIDNPIRMDG